MKRYHIEKQTRLYSGEGYSGYTSSSLGIPGPLEFDTIEECLELLPKLQDTNPVGWNVFDSITGECVIGQNLFKD